MESSKATRTTPTGNSGGRAAGAQNGLLYFAAAGAFVAALVAVVVFSGAGPSGGGPNGAAGNPAPAVTPLGTLAADSGSHEFGLVLMGKGKVSHAFRLRNAGNEPALIRKLYTSCTCTTVTLLDGGESYGPFGMPNSGYGPIPDINLVVDAGREVTVQAVFDPKAYGAAGVGLNNRVVSVKLGTGKELRLKLTAFVRQ